MAAPLFKPRTATLPMSFLDKIHKKIDKEKQEEIETKVKELTRDFIRFQLDKNMRAVITNQYQNNEQYPPNVLVDLITSFSYLAWRPVSENEKKELEQKLAENAGIVIPKNVNK